MINMEKPGKAYRDFLTEVKKIDEPYMSDRWLQEYAAVLRRADLPDFAKLPFLALPLNPDYIRI